MSKLSFDDPWSQYFWENREALTKHTSRFWGDVYKNYKSGASRERAIEGVNSLLGIRNRMSNRTRVHPEGYDGAANAIVGYKNRVYGCSKSYGRRHRLSMQPVVKSLLNEQKTLFQSLVAGLGTAYKTNGVNPLNIRGTSANPLLWPRTVWFPVYVYRLSCANGKQNDQATGGMPMTYPTVQYRLQGTQDSDGAEWYYNWVLWEPANNSNATFPTWNGYNPILLERDFQTQKVYHESNSIKVLLTAPTGSTVDCNIDIVEFTNGHFAPPDQYSSAVGDVSYDTFNISVDDTPQIALENEYYSMWLFNKNSHPCAMVKKPPGLVGPPPFRVLQSHKMVLTGKDTTNTEAGGNQYFHKHYVKDYKWYNTIYPHVTQNSEGPDVDPIGTVTQKVVEKLDNSGVFIPKERQKWLMISCFGNSVLGNGSVFNPLTEASFDISITNSFKCVNA